MSVTSGQDFLNKINTTKQNSKTRKRRGAKIRVTTEKDFNRLLTKLAQIEMQYPQFLASALTTIINQEIVDAIHDKMRSQGISRKIIDTTFLSTTVQKSTNDIRFKIISNFVSETGFPVAQIIEHGRRAYTIKAPEPTADRPNPHLKFIKNGNTIFAKKVDIPELPARKIIQSTINKKIPRIQRRLNAETKRWFKGILRS